MRYRIGKQIGDPGGFGSVHICTSEVGDNYAIKFLDNMDVASTERFKKEIRLSMRLSHPNVIKIIAYDTEGARKYYIMPLYLSSLKAIITDLYGKYDRQYSVISEILNGVIYLHSEGVLHRDLKPQNILYNSDSDIVINDFGLGRQVDSGSDRLTRIGAGFGTFRYAAPEQFADASSVDEKADIYSIGKIIEDIVTSMSTYAVPTPELDYIIDKCSQTSPQRRFSSAAELKSAIDSVYQHLLGISESNTTEDLLAKLKLGNVSYDEVNELAIKLLNHRNSDKLEEFFRSIPDAYYHTLEKSDGNLIESLIISLQQFYTGQEWGFRYTDTIGSNCERLYNLSNNTIVKANLLYTIIKVGISHNRWYVMGIATNLVKSATHDIAECLELANLLAEGHTYLNSLDIEYVDLPTCLQPCYEYKKDETEEEMFPF